MLGVRFRGLKSAGFGLVLEGKRRLKMRSYAWDHAGTDGGSPCACAFSWSEVGSM
jgi:hypothetical protein